MKVLVTGASGQLGQDLVEELRSQNIETISTDIKGDVDIFLDITNINEVKMLLHKERPDAIIHTAGYTDVEKAEDIENKNLCYAINVLGTRNIAQIGNEIGAKVLYISSDYVFDGKGRTAYKPDDKKFGPMTYYGQTKLEGEKEILSLVEKYFIVRISWVFGIHGKNFVETMLKLSETHSEISVIKDQVGSPTYTRDVSKLLVDIIKSDKYGIYHATNSGFISWAKFAQEIFKIANIKTKVNPCLTSEYKVAKAKRPLNSRLDKSKLATNGFYELPDYKDAIKRYLEERKNENK